MVTSLHTAVVSTGDPAAPQPTKSFFGLIALGVFLATSVIAILLDAPPAPIAAGTQNGFSAEAAMKHVAVIASKPHPLGSSQHDVVRNYIFQTLTGFGYSPSIQKTTATNKWEGAAGSVENIVTRIEGSQNGKALLLVAHYDSVPWGAGAADDGSAVAALLEVARMLKSHPPLDRTVVFLFSDGEEDGLLGAQAFATEHPWARDVGIVLNFEARGSRGPVIMFETSNQNGWLLDNFARASSRPVANSLAYEIYKRLPNDTDFTVFKAQGYSGLNFAFIDGLSNYHTALDSITNLDQSSLQQQGDYLFGLVQRFGGITADDPRLGNSIYFDVLGRILMRYSYIEAIFLLAFAAVALAAVSFVGFHRKGIERKLLRGAVTILLSLVASVAAALAIPWIVSAGAAAAPQVRLGLLYHPGLYVAAYSILAFGVGTLVYSLNYRRVDSFNTCVAAMFVWFLLTFITTITVPGATFIFLVPLLFSLIGWLVVLQLNLYTKISGKIILMAAVLPGILILAPLLHQIVTALTLGATLPVSIMLTLLAGLMAATVWPDVMPHPRLLTSLLAGGGLVLLILAAAVSFADKHPRRDSLFHAFNADTGQQIWLSYDDWKDPWTAQFFANGNDREARTDLFPGSSRKLLQSPASLPQVPPPTVTVLEDKKTTSERHLRLRLNSMRHAPVLWMYVNSSLPVRDLMVNGVKSDLFRVDSNTGVLRYYGLPQDGVELAFTVGLPASVNLKLEDISYNLENDLAGSFQPRPTGYIPYPARLNDSRIVIKSFSL